MNIFFSYYKVKNVGGKSCDDRQHRYITFPINSLRPSIRLARSYYRRSYPRVLRTAPSIRSNKATGSCSGGVISMEVP